MSAKQPTPPPNRLPDGSIDVRYRKPDPSSPPPPVKHRSIRINAVLKPHRGPR